MKAVNGSVQFRVSKFTLHVYAIQVMKEIDNVNSGQQPKKLEDYLARNILEW